MHRRSSHWVCTARRGCVCRRRGRGPVRKQGVCGRHNAKTGGAPSAARTPPRTRARAQCPKRGDMWPVFSSGDFFSRRRYAHSFLAGWLFWLGGSCFRQKKKPGTLSSGPPHRFMFPLICTVKRTACFFCQASASAGSPTGRGFSRGYDCIFSLWRETCRLRVSMDAPSAVSKVFPVFLSTIQPPGR